MMTKCSYCILDNFCKGVDISEYGIIPILCISVYEHFVFQHNDTTWLIQKFIFLGTGVKSSIIEIYDA